MGPTRLLKRRAALALSVLAALALMLAVAGGAAADTLTPESGGSPNADDIDTLYKFVFALGVVVFVGVEGVLIYTLVKYRQKRHGPAPAQIRGNTRLEIGWTAGAAGLLVIITAVMFLMLGDIEDPPDSLPGGLQTGRGGGESQFAAVGQAEPPSGKALEIEVTGQQYLWRFDYPGRERLFSYHTMYVPTETTVTLKITSQDVMHSWWIPKLGAKKDAVPGHVIESWFRVPASKDGERQAFTGECAELCGEGHADHYARVVALPPEEYRAWAARQTQAISDAMVQLSISRRERTAAGEAVDPERPEGG